MATYKLAKVPSNVERISNPGSTIVSGVMMFEYIGWNEVSNLIVRADLARQMPGAKGVSASAFGEQIIRGMTA